MGLIFSSILKLSLCSKDIKGNFGRNYIAVPTRGKGNSWKGKIKNLNMICMCVKFNVHRIIITP